MEIWKQIPDQSYEISNRGRVRRGGRILTPRVHLNGYLRVTLYPSRKHFYIHRLVAQAFIDNPEQKRVVNHKDGSRLNNYAENLEWATDSENLTHYYRGPLFKGKIFSDTHRRNLSEARKRSWEDGVYAHRKSRYK